jgi:membrane protease YdiL (CAAX protease family)
LSGREYTGGKGFLKATGWSLVFGVEGLTIGLLIAAGLGVLIHGGHDAAWFSRPGLWQALVQGTGLVIGFGFATWHIGHRVIGRSWADLRWKEMSRPGPWFGKGFLLGLVAAAAAMVLGLGVAGASWSTGEGTLIGWSGSSLWTVVALALPALSEEIIFRGLPLVLFAGVIGRWPAIALTAVVFGLAHWSNPDVTGLGLANITLAGVLLATAFYAPGGIWTAWGAHLGWNVSLAVLGARVSGLPLSIPWLEYHPGGPDWVTGGAFGPEGGILATAAMAGAIIFASRWTTTRKEAA